MNSIEVSGKTVEQAIEIGLYKLNATKDDVKIIVLDEGGLFDKAKVKLILNSAYEELSETEKFVNDLTEKMKLNVTYTVEETPKQLSINFIGEDIGTIIGKRGDTLDALQYLISQIVNKNAKKDEFVKILLDCEGYRKKRETTLTTLANRLADKVVKENRSHRLEPMNAYERKIVHMALEGRKNVTTISKNEEPHRYITIMPIKERSFND